MVFDALPSSNKRHQIALNYQAWQEHPIK